MSDRGSWNVLLSHPDGRYPEKVKRRRTKFWMWNIRRRWKVGRIEFLPGWNELFCASQGGPSACARCRDPSPWWLEARIAIWSNSMRIPQEDTTLVNITPRTIAYPIRICCPDHWLKRASPAKSFRQPATAHVPPPSDGVSERLVRTSLPWIPKNSPQSRIALVIKKLSKHQNLTQFD